MQLLDQEGIKYETYDDYGHTIEICCCETDGTERWIRLYVKKDGSIKSDDNRMVVG